MIGPGHFDQVILVCIFPDRVPASFGYPSTICYAKLDRSVEGGLFCTGYATGYDFFNHDSPGFA